MNIVLILGETTEIIIKIIIQRISKSREVFIPTAILPSVITEHIVVILAEIKCGTVTFVIFILELVVKLQEDIPGERLSPSK